MGLGIRTMEDSTRGAIEIEAELSVPSARVQFVHYHFNRPPDSMLRVEGKSRVELCLTSRHHSARACFRDQWSARRFERVGPLFLVPPGLDLWVRSDEESSMTSIVCELDVGRVLESFDRLSGKTYRLADPTDRLLLAGLDLQDAKLRSLLLRLTEEARHPGFASGMLVESIAAQMVVELFRCRMAIDERGAHGGLAPWQLRRIDERLQELRAPTLPALAELCRISVRQLMRSFHVSRGCAIGAYVANSQMQHAKSLLAADESVAAIADTLGFSSSSNFCFAFRRATGMTPGQFRKTLLGH